MDTLREDFQAFLKEVVADGTRRVYAVVDGAQIKNLPDRLENAGSVPGDSLAHAPLLRDEDRNNVLTGPWLVSPYLYDLSFEDQYDLLPDGSAQQKETIVHRPAADPARQMDILFAMLDDLRAAVFWIGDETLTRERLSDHLVGLNTIRAELPDEPEEGFQPVTFRHADANALAQTIPALDPCQSARLLGPAQILAALPHPVWTQDGSGHMIRVTRPEGTPSCDPAEPLSFDTRTMSAIRDRRMKGFERRIASSLREVTPDDPTIPPLSQAGLEALVARSMADAQKYGVETEAGHFRWAFMSLQTNETFSKQIEVQAFMTDCEYRHLTPDERVALLMDAVIARAVASGTSLTPATKGVALPVAATAVIAATTAAIGFLFIKQWWDARNAAANLNNTVPILKPCVTCNASSITDVFPDYKNPDYGKSEINSDALKKWRTLTIPRNLKKEAENEKERKLDECLKIACPPPTLNSKYRGGAHFCTSKPTGDGLDSHHMPAKSLSRIPPDLGPAIQMDPDDHKMTNSFAIKKKSMKPTESHSPLLTAPKKKIIPSTMDTKTKKYERQRELLALGGSENFMAAFDLDAQDVKNSFPEGKYEEAIEQARKYAECIAPLYYSPAPLPLD